LALSGIAKLRDKLLGIVTVGEGTPRPIKLLPLPADPIMNWIVVLRVKTVGQMLARVDGTGGHTTISTVFDVHMWTAMRAIALHQNLHDE